MVDKIMARAAQDITIYRYAYPLGDITTFWEGELLVGLSLRRSGEGAQKTSQYLARYLPMHSGEYRETEQCRRLAGWLDSYFAGEDSPVPVSIKLYGSDFHRDVWQALRLVPYGSTVSYKQLAEAVGTDAYQAIGTAMALNPIAIVVPCHRVLKHDGTLGGYSAADGPSTKQRLLELEGAWHPPESDQLSLFS